jgi:hypothetical protein
VYTVLKLKEAPLGLEQSVGCWCGVRI